MSAGEIRAEPEPAGGMRPWFALTAVCETVFLDLSQYDRARQYGDPGRCSVLVLTGVYRKPCKSTWEGRDKETWKMGFKHP
jgi:hypothetical protein